VEIFCLSLSVEKLFNNIFSFGWRIRYAAKIWGLLGILNPLAKFGETATPKSISLRQTASFEA
jgi:hypothetical protein